MSNLIVILGESGTGKSRSIKTLNPEHTFIINTLNKPLPFRGYRKKYNDENKNYIETDSTSTIAKYIHAINLRRPEITTIVIDDFSFIMNNEYMRRCKEIGFNKFLDMGANTFDIMDVCKDLRPDLTCIIMCHTEKDHAGMIVPQTIGKMTKDYVGIEKRVSLVLHTQIHDGQYKFLTQNNNLHMAKSAEGMFESLLIDNDLAYVIKCMHDYYNEEEVPIEKLKLKNEEEINQEIKIIP